MNMQTTNAGVTRALVRAVRDIRWEESPADAREAARQCLLDFLGCALAGSSQPLAQILLTEIAAREGSSEATLVGRQERCSRSTAALVNGAAGHALDFDDTHMTMGGHPSVPVIPSALALAETIAANGQSLLEAIIAGVELECRLGAIVGREHYAIGFHSTGTLGAFGAAAACAHLLQLDEDGWLRAMGLAGTQAAGLKSAFGTMAKPLHAGRAASNGLLSALAARGGFTSSAAILEAEQGFLASHAGAAPSAQPIDQVAGRFLIRDTLFKYHASCYLTHAPINAAARIQAEQHLDPKTIDDVEVRVARSLLKVCDIQSPTTGLEGKFSLRATTAMALRGEDTSDLGTFSDARMTDPDLVALRDRVRIVTIDKTPQTRARVIVSARGRQFEAESDSGQPASDLDLQRERLTRKFRGLTSPILERSGAEALARAVMEVEKLATVSELMRLTVPR
jgi:2-methylcitrate dehydratase PrpD